jgi:hypothetical protein
MNQPTTTAELSFSYHGGRLSYPFVFECDCGERLTVNRRDVADRYPTADSFDCVEAYVANEGWKVESVRGPECPSCPNETDPAPELPSLFDQPAPNSR